MIEILIRTILFIIGWITLGGFVAIWFNYLIFKKMPKDDEVFIGFIALVWPVVLMLAVAIVISRAVIRMLSMASGRQR